MLLLEHAEHSNTRTDADLHTSLGFLEQISGNTQAALHEYQEALKADPMDSVAEGDLALLEARSGHVQNAIPLWQSVSQNDPAESAASLNLAVVQCALGHTEAATQALTRLLKFSPDDQKARKMLISISSGTQQCGQ
jgi:tetratricopeptide (TPR) repeat protein